MKFVPNNESPLWKRGANSWGDPKPITGLNVSHVWISKVLVKINLYFVLWSHLSVRTVQRLRWSGRFFNRRSFRCCLRRLCTRTINWNLRISTDFKSVFFPLPNWVFWISIWLCKLEKLVVEVLERSQKGLLTKRLKMIILTSWDINWLGKNSHQCMSRSWPGGG